MSKAMVDLADIARKIHEANKRHAPMDFYVTIHGSGLYVAGADTSGGRGDRYSKTQIPVADMALSHIDVLAHAIDEIALRLSAMAQIPPDATDPAATAD